MLHPGRPATLANWQQGPFNRWSFLDVDRVVPTAAISRGGAPVPPFAVRERDILDVRVPRVSGDPGSVADVLRETDTDAFLVLVDGVIVHESYANTGGRNSRHLLMSVTKSFVGVVAGILADRGILDLDGQITDHVREVVGFGYDEASVRHLLDMRCGIAFSEEYLNPDGEVRILEHAASWRPYQAGLPTSTYDYLSRLPADGPHRGVFRYRSCETDILGSDCERAAGVDMATLLSALIWQKIGTENGAYFAIDSAGAAVHDGGLCATARDVARFGELLLDDGRASSGERVLPEGWTRDVLAGAADGRDAFAATSSFDTGMPGDHYRHQLGVPFADGQVVLAPGIHGQMVYIDQETRTSPSHCRRSRYPKRQPASTTPWPHSGRSPNLLAPATGHHQSQERS